MLERQPSPLLSAELSEKAVDLPARRLASGPASQETIDELFQALPFSRELALVADQHVGIGW